MNKYRIIKLLGSGSFGKVYLVKNILTNKEYALKRISYSDKNSLKDYKNELAVLKLVKSNYIIKIYEPQYTKIEILI